MSKQFYLREYVTKYIFILYQPSIVIVDSSFRKLCRTLHSKDKLCARGDREVTSGKSTTS
jgi:hypothetical protein